jgi:cell wall-associated NlpC family hydrolase
MVGRESITCFCLAVFLLVFQEGCGRSSPRFAGHEKKNPVPEKHTPPPPPEQQNASTPRFSSTDAEEKKANEKQPDSTEVKSHTDGGRDFRKEKNEALTPLEQSKLMREISKYMGTPYLHGGTGLDGMDCSGYTMVVFKNALGKLLPRTSSAQSKLGKHVVLEDLKFGDLVFFNTTGEEASHVGVYLGDDLFAHASVNQGVTISSLQSSYYSKRFESARRVIGE